MGGPSHIGAAEGFTNSRNEVLIRTIIVKVSSLVVKLAAGASQLIQGSKRPDCTFIFLQHHKPYNQDEASYKHYKHPFSERVICDTKAI